MSFFILLSASIVVTLYRNITRATPFLSEAQKTGADAPSSASCLRLVGRCTANRRNHNRQRPQMRPFGGAPSRPQAQRFALHFPSFARREQSPTNHYKQPPCFRFVRRWVLCGGVHNAAATTHKKAPLSTTSRGLLSVSVSVKGGAIKNSAKGCTVPLLLFCCVWCQVVRVVFSLAGKSPPRSIATWHGKYVRVVGL